MAASRLRQTHFVSHPATIHTFPLDLKNHIDRSELVHVALDLPDCRPDIVIRLAETTPI